MDYCLKNYVTIKDCGGAPLSGQYLNQLPGISLESTQKIANGEQVTYVGVFAEVQDRSWNRFLNDYRVKLRAKYKLKKDCVFADRICDDKDTFLQAWMYLLGAELMIERTVTPRINKLTTIDANKAEELRDMFTGMYENAMDDIINATRIEKEDPCFECRESFVRVERLP